MAGSVEGKVGQAVGTSVYIDITSSTVIDFAGQTLTVDRTEARDA